MLTRVFIDNYRCFVNFEYRPAPKQVIFGGNGSGKTSFLSALLAIRQFTIAGLKVEAVFPWSSRTRWLNQTTQTIEIEALLDGKKYAYRLLVDRTGDPPVSVVSSETVTCDGKPLFEFVNGDVRLFNDQFEQGNAYPFDRARSAFATIGPRKDGVLAHQFKRWLEMVYCFRIDPIAMELRAEQEDLAPNVNLSNFAAWYRHLIQADVKQTNNFTSSLRSTLSAFNFLELEHAGENRRLLVADFDRAQGASVRFGLNELSEGQRCLIALYAILHFLLARGCTVIIDEPDNFVSLREIQPWLSAVSDLVDDGQGQVFLISHHPEILNQWAPDFGMEFVRDGAGPARVEKFHADAEATLSPSELVARGWERE